MLNVRDLTVDYGDGPVLDRLQMTLSEARVHGLVGRNGEGKTTLLNALNGFVPVRSGTMEWKDRALQPSDIAYLPTDVYFYPMITAEEYLQVFQSQNPAFDVDAWNKLFELPLGDFIETYSTGMKKKLALLSVLALDRPILMLDEPFNGLDLESNLLLGRLLALLASRGKTVLVTSHVLESLSDLCDEIHLLAEGRIARTYSREDVHDLRSMLLSDIDRNALPLLEGLLK